MSYQDEINRLEAKDALSVAEGGGLNRMERNTLEALRAMTEKDQVRTTGPGHQKDNVEPYEKEAGGQMDKLAKELESLKQENAKLKMTSLQEKNAQLQKELGEARSGKGKVGRNSGLDHRDMGKTMFAGAVGGGLWAKGAGFGMAQAGSMGLALLANPITHAVIGAGAACLAGKYMMGNNAQGQVRAVAVGKLLGKGAGKTLAVTAKGLSKLCGKGEAVRKGNILGYIVGTKKGMARNGLGQDGKSQTRMQGFGKQLVEANDKYTAREKELTARAEELGKKYETWDKVPQKDRDQLVSDWKDNEKTWTECRDNIRSEVREIVREAKENGIEIRAGEKSELSSEQSKVLDKVQAAAKEHGGLDKIPDDRKAELKAELAKAETRDREMSRKETALRRDFDKEAGKVADKSEQRQVEKDAARAEGRLNGRLAAKAEQLDRLKDRKAAAVEAKDQKAVAYLDKAIARNKETTRNLEVKAGAIKQGYGYQTNDKGKTHVVTETAKGEAARNVLTEDKAKAASARQKLDTRVEAKAKQAVDLKSKIEDLRNDRFQADKQADKDKISEKIAAMQTKLDKTQERVAKLDQARDRLEAKGYEKDTGRENLQAAADRGGRQKTLEDVRTVAKRHDPNVRATPRAVPASKMDKADERIQKAEANLQKATDYAKEGGLKGTVHRTLKADRGTGKSEQAPRREMVDNAKRELAEAKQDRDALNKAETAREDGKDKGQDRSQDNDLSR